MEFSGGQAIYLQIAERICERILSRAWKQGERIPSVRELAEDIRVNPNTVMRSYAHLQELGIIHTQRGLGCFVAEDAAARTKELKRQSFIARELPQVFKTMDLLGMSCDELARLYAQKRDEARRSPASANPDSDRPEGSAESARLDNDTSVETKEESR